MNWEQKQKLIRILLAAVLLLVIGQLPLHGGPRLLAYLVP